MWLKVLSELGPLFSSISDRWICWSEATRKNIMEEKVGLLNPSS
jgi:hypothetical protein